MLREREHIECVLVSVSLYFSFVRITFLHLMVILQPYLHNCPFHLVVLKINKSPLLSGCFYSLSMP